MIRRIVVFFSAFVLAFSTSHAYAQAIPPGSYQQSCNGIHLRGASVVANCSAPGGQRITSSTNILCRGDIGNVNGYLRCNGGANAHGPLSGTVLRPGGNWGAGTPAGSYRQTCQQAHMQGTVLVANCSTGTGGVLRSTLDMQSCRPGTLVGNQSGILNCRIRQ